MQTNTKLGLGSVLAILGGIGLAVGPILGIPDLPWPLPFLAGFAVGISAGAGGALALFGLIERRKGS